MAVVKRPQMKSGDNWRWYHDWAFALMCVVVFGGLWLIAEIVY